MEKYIVNYHTGVTEEVEVSDLSEAKKVAEEGIAYTQEKITIETLDGEVITTAYWYEISPQEDDNVLETVGGGFYQTWSDELGSNSPLVGLKEFAEILGWDKARLSAKFSRQRDGKKVRPLLPDPIQILASTPVWTLKQAKKYKAIIDGRSAK